MLVDGADDDSVSVVVSYLVMDGPRYRAVLLSHHHSRRRFWHSDNTTAARPSPRDRRDGSSS